MHMYTVQYSTVQSRAIFVNIAENGEVFQLMVEFRDDQTLMYFQFNILRAVVIAKL